MTHPQNTTPANPAQGVSGERLAQQLADIARSLLSRPAELRGPYRHDEESLIRVAALPPRTSKAKVNVTELTAAIGAGNEEPVGKWAIDRSTDSPILTYENCSVIQDEQAFYVLNLIRAAIGAGGQAVAWQRRQMYSDIPGYVPEWQFVSKEEATGHFERRPGYEYRPLYIHPAPSGQAVAVKALDAIQRAKGHLENVKAHGNTEANAVVVIEKALDLCASTLSNPPAQPGWRDMSSAPNGEEVLIAYWRWRNSMSPGTIVVQSAMRTEFHGPGIWSWVVNDNKHGPFPIRGWSEGDMLGWMPLPAAPQPTSEGE